MNNTSPTRRCDYDLLRVVSMAAVVFLHTAAGALRDFSNPALWHVSNLLAAVFVSAVPIFFMLSGALLLGSKRTDQPLFVLKHRVPRVLLPGLFWSGVVIGYTWYSQGAAAALEQLLHLPNTTVLVAYWFLYALIPMYLLSPLLKRMVDHFEPIHWRYMIGLWVILTMGMQTVAFLIPEPWKTPFIPNATLSVGLLEGYLGYFMLGAFFARLERIPSRKLLWTVALADWAIIALGTWYFMDKVGVYGEQFISYRALFVMVLAACLFLLARSYMEHRQSGRVLTLLAGCSFGVYLAHPFAIRVVGWLFPITGIGTLLLSWGLAVLLSVAGVMLVASIKPLCYLVTGQKFDVACRESNLFALKPLTNQDNVVQ